MGKTRGKSVWIWAVVLIVLSVLAVVGGNGRQFFSRQSVESPHDRFLRAVYVLKALGGPAAAEEVSIPRRIAVSDAAESLLHHPDRHFVLRSLVAELTSLKETLPEAALFEAYARADLGETRQASSLLSTYVVEHPYQARHYALLCSLLETLRDYRALLLICAEWRERDAACRSERLPYAWLALCGLGRFVEARDLVLKEGDCLEWRRYFYASRAALAAGNTGEANTLAAEGTGAAPNPGEAEALRLRLQSIDFGEQ